MPPRCQRWRCDECTEDAGMSNRPAGPGGVKIVATSSTGKIGVRGCSFMGRGETSPGNDAAFLERRVYTLFGKLAAPTFLTLKSWPTLPRPVASILAKGMSKDTMPTVRGRLSALAQRGRVIAARALRR